MYAGARPLPGETGPSAVPPLTSATMRARGSGLPVAMAVSAAGTSRM